MKAFVCEMCNSQDLVKQDGFFICQSCGTKYTIEEAKKLLVEIEGAVKIDNSNFVEKYLQNARRAISKQDWAEVEKYYNMVEQNDPDNIEAIFYSAYGKAKQTLVESDIYKREAAFKVLQKSISILDDNFDIAKADDLIPVMDKITEDIVSMFGSEFVYNRKTNEYGTETWSDKSQTYQMFINLASEQFDTLGNIVNKLPADDTSHIVAVHKLRHKIIEKMSVSKQLSNDSRRQNAELGVKIVSTIKKYEPSFKGFDFNGILYDLDESDRIEKQTKYIGIGIVVAVVIGFIWFISWLFSSI